MSSERSRSSEYNTSRKRPRALTTKDTKVHEGKSQDVFLRAPSCPLWLLLFRPWPPRDDRRRDPAPRTKFASHLGPHRPRPLHHIFQHLVDDVLLKDPQIAVALQILLQ